MQYEAEIVVVGAGIVGLAAAWQVMQRYPEKSMIIVDKEPTVALHQSGRNSGVIHSGIYYRPGSLKATLCIQGRSQMLEFLNDHRLPYELSGKIIVALSTNEVPSLRTLFDQGLKNGVQGLELVDAAGLKSIEPQAAGVEAIYSPATGIVDYRQVAQALADDLTRAGHGLLLDTPVERIDENRRGISIWSRGHQVARGRFGIVAAGLYSDVLAYRSGLARNPRIVPFRGEYWRLRAGREWLVRSMIYPVPDPRFPFLGVHFTRRIADGTIWIGPNAVLGLGREDYRRRGVRTVRLSELVNTLAFPGFWRMAAQYWRSGLAEMYRSVMPAAYVQLARGYVPSLTRDDIVPGPVGVRAQTLDVSGVMSDDFLISRRPHTLFVRNAPSPAATASLAIGEYLVKQAAETFTW